MRVTGRARPSARPAAGVRASRADARGGPGTGPPPGRSLTRTAPGPAHAPASPDRTARAGVPPPVPVKPGARPPGHARQSGDVRPITGAWQSRSHRGAACFPPWQFPANRRARYRPPRTRPVRPVARSSGRLAGSAMGWAAGRVVRGVSGLPCRSAEGAAGDSRIVCLARRLSDFAAVCHRRRVRIVVFTAQDRGGGDGAVVVARCAG